MTTTAPESGRHPVNVGHLVMGLALTGLVVVWALVQYDVVGGSDIRWLLPVPWIAAGAAGLIASTLSARRPAPQQAGSSSAVVDDDHRDTSTSTEPTTALTTEPTEEIR